MVIEKSMEGPSAEFPDQILVTLTIGNEGLAPSYDLLIGDFINADHFDPQSIQALSIPEGFLFSQDATSLSIAAPEISFAPGQEAVLSFIVTALPEASSPLLNVASILHSTSLDPTLDQPSGISPRIDAPINASASLPIPSIESYMKATILNYDGSPLGSGDIIEYTILVENTGGANASGVSLETQIPDDTVFQNGSLVVDGVSTNLSPENAL